MTARQITMEVCAKHEIPPVLMLRGGNQPEYVAARSEAMARCRNELRMSYPRIGKIFHRHHTTVIHAVQKFDKPESATPSQQSLERRLVSQAQIIGSQARMMGEQARQIEELADEVAALRQLTARKAGQGELFA